MRAMRAPVFSTARIAWSKASMADFERRETESPAGAISLAGSRLLGAVAPGRESVYGNAATRSAIRGHDISAYYLRHFSRQNLAVTVCSDLPASDILARVANEFKDFPAGPGLEPPRAPAAPGGERTCTTVRASVLTTLAWVLALPGADESRFVLGKLAEATIGKGMDCRLWPLRSRDHLAYSLQADYEPGLAQSRLIVAVKVSPADVAAARTAVEAILDDLAANGLNPAEWENACRYARTEWWRSGPTKEECSTLLAWGIVLGWGDDFLSRVPDAYSSATRVSFNAFLQQACTPANRLTVTVGPAPDSSSPDPAVH
jgi:zinc protease